VGAPIVASPSGRSVAKITYFDLGSTFAKHDEESAANARLIAAAPELLEALKLFAQLEIPSKPEGNAGFYSIPFNRIEAARAAIAKALGQEGGALGLGVRMPAVDWTKPLELMDGTPVRLVTEDEGIQSNPDKDGDYWIRREDGERIGLDVDRCVSPEGLGGNNKPFVRNRTGGVL
jgi:hypothetical protein